MSETAILQLAGVIQGPPGKDGKSAYEYAVEGGYTGTEEEFAKKTAVEYSDPIVNTVSGESLLVIPDSAERTIEDLKIFGSTEQLTTTGANLLDLSDVVDENSKANSSYTRPIDIHPFVVEEGQRYMTISEGTTTTTTAEGDLTYSCIIFGEDDLDYFKTDTHILKFPASIIFSNNKEYRQQSVNNATKTATITKMLLFGNVQEEDAYDVKKLGVFKLKPGVDVNTILYEPYTGGKPSPSIEYPQEIRSVGRYNEETGKYEVDVTISGKNIVNPNNIMTGETFVKADGTKMANHITSFLVEDDIVTATVSNVNTVWCCVKVYVIPNMEYEIVIMPILNIGTVNDTFIRGITFYDKNNNIIGGKWNYINKFFTPIYNTEYIHIGIGIMNGKVNTQTKFKVQVKYKNYSKDYEPYREPQTVTLSLDQPLRQVANRKDEVTKDGIIRNIHSYAFSRIVLNDYIWERKVFRLLILDLPNFDCLSNYTPLISVGKADVFTGNQRIHWNVTEYDMRYIGVNEEDNLLSAEKKVQAFLADKDLLAIYYAKTPIIEPIPEDIRQEFEKLFTYYPTTTIAVDSGEVEPSSVSLTYTADPKNYIDNKFSELNAALVTTQSQLLQEK